VVIVDVDIHLGRERSAEPVSPPTRRHSPAAASRCPHPRRDADHEMQCLRDWNNRSYPVISVSDLRVRSCAEIVENDWHQGTSFCLVAMPADEGRLSFHENPNRYPRLRFAAQKIGREMERRTSDIS
jgi:hypothetical protein